MRQRTEPKLRLSEIGPTNAVVHSDAECKVIKAALRGAEEALLCLPASALTLRKKSANAVRRYRFALAPHKKLPADIWLHIFQLCSESGRGAASFKLSPLLVLPQICSGWRKLLIACPAFWSNVCTDDSSYALFHARTWLSRAGNIPRSLKIKYSGFFEDKDSEILSLFPFRALDISTSYPYELANVPFSKIPIQSLLPLEELILNDYARWSSRPQRMSFSPHSLPNLTCLIIGEHATFPMFEGPRPFATWPKLQKLALRCLLPKIECLSILRDATSVEECSMFVGADGGRNLVAEGVVLPNLATLKLYFSSESDAQPFLDMLTLPNLTSLKLGNPGCGEGCDEATLGQLVKRSGMKTMETLMMSNTAKRLDIGILLEILPSLCRLEILTDIAPLGASTINRIGNGELGPRLRVLHIRGNWQLELDSLLVITELRRRQPQERPTVISPSRLEQVLVEDHPRPLNEIEEWRIRQLSNDGIEFKILRVKDMPPLHRRILA